MLSATDGLDPSASANTVVQQPMPPHYPVDPLGGDRRPHVRGVVGGSEREPADSRKSACRQMVSAILFIACSPARVRASATTVFWLHQIERFAQDLVLQCLFAQQPPQLAHLAL